MADTIHVVHNRSFPVIAATFAMAVFSVASITAFASPSTSVSAKKCAKGKALYKTSKGTRCVKKCPAGMTKKKVKKRLTCVKNKAQGPVAPTPPAGPTPPPVTSTPTAPPPPAPEQVQLTRNDPAGQQVLGGGNLLLERGSCASVTCEYYRFFLYANGVYRAYAVDWNNVSGEICRSGSKAEGTWTMQEAYTYGDSGGGTVVKLSTGDVLVFPTNEPNNVYILSNGQLIRFDKNPNMLDSC